MDSLHRESQTPLGRLRTLASKSLAPKVASKFIFLKAFAVPSMCWCLPSLVLLQCPLLANSSRDVTNSPSWRSAMDPEKQEATGEQKLTLHSAGEVVAKE